MQVQRQAKGSARTQGPAQVQGQDRALRTRAGREHHRAQVLSPTQGKEGGQECVRLCWLFVYMRRKNARAHRASSNCGAVLRNAQNRSHIRAQSESCGTDGRRVCVLWRKSQTARERGGEAFDEGGCSSREQIAKTKPESQWIVITRPLYHLQQPVSYSSRLQVIHSSGYENCDGYSSCNTCAMASPEL